MSAVQPKTIVITSLPGKSSMQKVIRLESPTPVGVMDDLFDGGGPRKRRRLTHLTPEEKMLRRKLKNRVAAQTARDRKKAVMSDLELKVAELEEENKRLQKENADLKTQSGVLFQENSQLKTRLSQVSTSDKTELESGSAASSVPLPKEQALVLSCLMMHYTTSLFTMGMTLWLTCSNKSLKKDQVRKSQSCPQICKDELPVPRTPLSQIQWWGPQQQSWNPSMN